MAKIKPSGPKAPGVFTYLHPNADDILERIPGQSLSSICREEGMPTKWTVLRWVEKDEAFMESYSLAMRLRGHVTADEIADLRERLLRGEITPEIHREAKDSCKWEAGRRLPKVYGDKIGVEHSGTMTLEQLVTAAGKPTE
ncbi:MAG: hypothetical protein ABIR55_08845 [Burkholderiaceae bacterium]